MQTCCPYVPSPADTKDAVACFLHRNEHPMTSTLPPRQPLKPPLGYISEVADPLRQALLEAAEERVSNITQPITLTRDAPSPRSHGGTSPNSLQAAGADMRIPIPISTAFLKLYGC